MSFFFKVVSWTHIREVYVGYITYLANWYISFGMYVNSKPTMLCCNRMRRHHYTLFIPRIYVVLYDFHIYTQSFGGDGVRGLVYSLSMLTIFEAPSIFESHNSISTNVVWPWGLEMDGCAAIEFLDYLFFLRNKMNMCFYHQDGLQEINSEILHSGLKCHNK